MIKVVGIDPGLAGTGVGVVQGENGQIVNYSFGSINTDKKDPTCLRLNTIYTKIIDFLEKENPDLVVIEDIYSLEKYPKSGIMLGKVVGVLLVACYRTGVKIEEVSVREAKKVVSGNGNADKYQVEESTRNILNHKQPIRPFHASDALALALTGFFRYETYL
ncbi:MAG: crossover junction endodeoxyribonuclease RuvC [Desulfobacteraceae bacterium]|nr:crossover junction endodeoxyribonuclease RuvC [Desulfobacteraceae bacterium]